MRFTPWARWFNSFWFITIVVFVFAFLTTMVSPEFEGNGKFARAHTLGQTAGGQPPGRFRMITASRYGESIDPDYGVRRP